MDTPIEYTAFREGFHRKLASLIRVGHTKQALNPRFAGAAAAHALNPEAIALGGRLFHDSYRNPNILTALKSNLLTGYGQLRAAHELLDRPHTADELNHAFNNIGHTAKPRIDFANRAVAGATGAGVAGLGAAAVYKARGQREGQNNLAQTFGQLPLMERLKYLLAPQQFVRPALTPQNQNNEQE